MAQLRKKKRWSEHRQQLRSPTKSYYRGNFSMLCSSDTLQNNIFSSREAKETLHFRLFCIVSVISGWVLFHLALLKKGTTADSFLSEIWPFGGEEMLLRFTFVPVGWTRRPWRPLLRGGRRPMRGGRRPTSPSPSPPRAASGRRPWGSGCALVRGQKEGAESVWFVFLYNRDLLEKVNELSTEAQ